MTVRPAAIALVAFALAGCTSPGEADGRRPRLADCRLAGVDSVAHCGSLEVWEDRQSRKGRRIAIRFAVLPARRRAAEPDPIVVLAGGPGQAAMALGPQVLPLFSRLNDTRDIVLIDQRGTGESHALDCDDDKLPLQYAFEETLPEQLVKECAQRLDADPRHYLTTPAMADVDEILGALGYSRVNLWGGSYGSRAALEFLRRHPSRVRTVTLDGVAPMGMKLPLSFVADGDAAFERMLFDCESDRLCAKAYPELRRNLSRLRAHLARHPEQVSITDPVTGEQDSIRVTESVFLSGLFRPLYLPELASVLPFGITMAAAGDFNALLAQNLELAQDVSDNLSVGMHLSVLCSEDIPRITQEDLDQAGKSFFGRALVDDFIRACKWWPRGEVPSDYYEPVRSDAPVLILSGGVDPATPSRHAEEVAAMLPNSRQFVAPNLAHGVSLHGCAPRLIERFIRAGSAAQVDGSCLARIPRPLFLLPVGTRP